MRVKALRAIILAAICGGAAVAVCMIAMLGWQTLGTPMNVAAPGEWLNVAPGTSLTRISSELSRRGMLDSSWALNAYARYSGDATRIHAGEYLIDRGTTPRQLLEQLVSGRVHLHDMAIIEGWRFEDVIIALRNHQAVDASTLDSETVMAELGKPELHPEGQFYPDTYRFPRNTAAGDILRQAHDAMEDRLNRAWEQYRSTTVLTSPYDVLILASIIEKETAVNEERRRISGVFHRRMERGMRLQTDPTVIYGLGADFDGNLRRSDLARDTPYNTYTRSGFPPTPIALPSQESLLAAVNPDSGAELYFVATGLGDGSHHFSTTFDEHRAAVARYRSGAAYTENAAQ